MSVLKRTRQQGFTAVELLVTLFIAALFIASGYQLYAVTTTDSANIRARSIAGSIGYRHLRIEQAKTSFACNSTTIPYSSLPTQDKNELPGISSYTVARSMPKGDPCGNGLMKIQIDIKYKAGDGYITQSQVIYVNS